MSKKTFQKLGRKLRFLFHVTQVPSIQLGMLALESTEDKTIILLKIRLLFYVAVVADNVASI